MFVLALVMLAFAMNLSGVFEVGMRATGIGSGLQSRSGVTGSFFSGVIAWYFSLAVPGATVSETNSILSMIPSSIAAMRTLRA